MAPLLGYQNQTVPNGAHEEDGIAFDRHHNMASQQDLQTIWRWNSILPKAEEALVYDLIAETARNRPDALAVCAWDGDWTYHELDTLSSLLAHQLICLGIGPGLVVPIYFEKSRFTSIAMLAVMKAGGASVLLDVNLPEERLQAVIAQVNPVLALSSALMHDSARRLIRKPTMVIDDVYVEHLIDFQAPAKLPRARPSDTLYVVFTSGSTGTPKGVIVTHSNFSSAVRYQQSLHGFRENSRVLDFASYAFDVSWSNALHSFTCGSCLCVPSEAERRDDLAGCIQRFGITYADLTPTTAGILPEQSIRSLKTLVLGGESLPLQMAKRWAAMTEVLNPYGPCECTPTSTIATVNSDSVGASIGKGVGVVTWVVDAEDLDALVPIGGVGELLLEGPLVGGGYLGDAEKTAAAFVEDPAWLLRGAPGQPGRCGRLYKTGDLVRQNTDGTLAFVARKDNQVKINGQRVELGDVEHHVRTNIRDGTNIQIVADIITTRDSNKTLLVVFLQIPTLAVVDAQGVRQTETKNITDGLDEKLAQQIPAYMIPSAYIPLESLPVTVTGKVDRRRLREMGRDLSLGDVMRLNGNGDRQRPLPDSPLEKLLQGLWSSILGIDAELIRADDSFLKLGGNSIGAMRLVGALREQGHSLAAAHVLKYPRLSDQAMVIGKLPGVDRQQGVKPYSLLRASVDIQAARIEAARLCKVSTAAITDIFPCTPLQEGLLALTAKGGSHYVARHLLELEPWVDISRFREALAKLVRVTPILRTRIADVAGQGLVQVVIDESMSWSPTEKLANVEEDTGTSKKPMVGLGTPLVQFAMVKRQDDEDERFFSLTIHHALYDGWSLSLMFEALDKAYRGETLSQQPPFQGFVKHLSGAHDTADANKYWETLFEDSEATMFPVLPSPKYQPRSDSTTTHVVESLEWPKIDVTPSIVVRVALAVLASQFTNSHDVVFGVTVAGRQAAVAGIERMVGPTIATVPVRVVLDKTQSIKRLLHQYQAQAVEMTAYEQTGLQSIRGASTKAAAACGFQTLLVVQPDDKDVEDESELFVKRSHDDQNRDQGLADVDPYALTIECDLRERGLRFRIVFDSSILPSDQVGGLAIQMDHIIRQMCNPTNLDKSLGEIEMLGEHDLRRIWAWNATVPDTVETPVHDMIAETTRRQPNAAAVCAWDGDWTYGELDSLSTRLAHDLARRGVCPDVIVPLWFEKSRWTPVAMLAVMKAGGASVLLDSSQPEQRRRNIVRQIKAPLIVSSKTNRKAASQLIDSDRPTVVVDDEHLAMMDVPDNAAHLPVVKSSNKAYLIFTSGSTGTPKGAVMTHANISSAAWHQRHAQGYQPDSRVYDFTSYAFDTTWSNFINIFTCGGCLCIPSENERKNDLVGSIQRLRPSIVDLTPSAAAVLQDDVIRSLKTLILGGERMSTEYARRWSDMVDLKSPYGPCECTPTASVATITPDSVDRLTIGKGVGLVTWVTDPERVDVLVPVGAVGELVLEGPLVGAGYLDDPDKTAAAFIENPSWLLRGAAGHHAGRRGRLYKTGDLVRYNPDGSLVFIGRKDSQVKINGQRLELAEVEHHILEQITKNDVHVRVVAEVIVPRDGVKSTLVAFVTDLTAASVEALRLKTKAIVAGLHDSLAAHIPSYMIPSAYVPIEKFPMTATGKLDRQRLRALGEAMTLEELMMLNASSDERRLPTTETEKSLQALWSHVLAINPDKIAANDSFLRLGGDSIAAMRLVALARDQGFFFTVADIFNQPQLSELAVVMKTCPETNSNQAIQPFSLLKRGIDIGTACREMAVGCKVDATQIEDAFPCTPLQEGLLALTSKRAGDYLARNVFELRPSVDVSRFQAAWEKVVKTTPILRTRIIDLAGRGLLQVIIDQPTQWSSTVGIPNLDAYRRADEQLPIGLGTPLVRFAVVEDDDENRRFFVWTIHHALYDGWSMPLILEKLEKAYEESEQPILAPSPPFQRFVKHIMDVNDTRAAQFWRSQFEELEAPIFPALPSPNYQPRTDAVSVHHVEGIEWPKVNATASTVLRAAWGIVAASYTNTDDALFGMTTTGRTVNIPGIDQIIGPTIATVPVRMAIDRKSTLEHFLLQAQSQTVELTEYEQSGLQRIRQSSQKTNAACQFQTLLVIQGKEQGCDPHSGLFIATGGDIGEDGDALAEFDTHALTLDCDLEAHGVRLRFGYDSNVISATQLERLANHLDQVLRQLCDSANIKKSVAEIETISHRDLEDIWGWNSKFPATIETPIHELVTETVQRQPESLAVTAWDGDWTYAELDRLATRLACHLVSIGVTPDSIVPLCFEKSKWTPVTALAVMKAGGASVLLDSTLPEDRLRTMTQQVEPSLILSSSSNQQLAGRLTDQPTLVINSEFLSQLRSGPSSAMQLPEVKPWNRLYVVFTSGSTGIPKGVVVTHSNLSSALRNQHGAHGFQAGSRVYDFASYAFDVAWANMLGAFECGACLCIPSDEERQSDLAGSLGRFQITHVEMTPSAARLLPREVLESLDTLILGGERLSTEDARCWASQVKHLRNSYGPCECTPTSTVANVDANVESGATIGRGVGVVTWVADAATGGSLVPVGAIGELLLEGPSVGPGYLDDAEKTATAFINDPAWLLRGLPGLPGHGGRRGRLYKTGDLVRYDQDGNLIFIGRKDSQVKINGQRVELGEIENHIAGSPSVRQAVSLLPKAGLCQGRLVGIFSLNEYEHGDSPSPGVELVPRNSKLPVQDFITNLRAHLDAAVPAYMVPSVWVAVKNIPLNASGKLNRKLVGEWLAALSPQTYADINQTSRGPAARDAANDAEGVIRDACSVVLNVPKNDVNLERSFIANGGDSISAMRLSPQCRASNVNFSVATLLRAKTLAEVARLSTCTVASMPSKMEQVNTVFGLTPIQQWFFSQVSDNIDNGDFHCNQSFYVKITRPVSPDELSAAILKIVQCHSMLRARFEKTGNGCWMQRVLEPADGVYHFGFSQLQSISDMETMAMLRQRELNVQYGPVFSADLCDLPSGGQYLVMMMHHLVVDLVSWRIILDDLEMLLNGSGSPQAGLPFQVWSHLQFERAQTSALDPEHVLSTEGIHNNLSFWNFSDTTPNATRDHIVANIKVDHDTTALLLKDANNAFNTEPVELLLSAIWDAFFQVFQERNGLTIFNECHGREPWSADIDLSRTVGWFTTMGPIHVCRNRLSANIVRLVKDSRRRLPANGWAYFASRYLNPKGMDAFKSHDSTMEVVFNYHGQFQQLEQENALFEVASLNDVSDVGPALPVSSLFEINATVEGGCTHFTFSWNRHISYQHLIRKWITQVGVSLQTICSHLAAARKSSRTLCDYELLGVDYDALEELETRTLPNIETINNAVTSGVYPCSPMVDGILISQLRDSAAYQTSSIFEIKSHSDSPIELEHLAESWQAVIARHPALRSVFIEGVGSNAAYDQVILESFRGEVILVHSTDKSSAIRLLKEAAPAVYHHQPKPPHRLTLCKIADESHVIGLLEMSHAITDGASTAIIVKDWTSAYLGTLGTGCLSDTSLDFARALNETPIKEKMQYWKNKLLGLEPCFFPQLLAVAQPGNATAMVHVDITGESFAKLQDFCEAQSVTPASLFQTAWALTLAAYTGKDSVCFGYLASGRDLFPGIENSIGAFANLLVCRADISREETQECFLKSIHQQVLEDLGFQHCSLADIQHQLDLPAGQALFNTVMSFQRDDEEAGEDEEKQHIEIAEIDGEDPTEVGNSSKELRLQPSSR